MMDEKEIDSTFSGRKTRYLMTNPGQMVLSDPSCEVLLMNEC